VAVGTGRPTGQFIDVGSVPSVGEYARRMWLARDFILYVPLGQLRAQTFNTLLGSFWHLLNPLLSAGIYYMLFGVLFNAARAIENYATFLIIGIFTFLYTNRSVQAGARSMTKNLNLITQIRFPRAALPLSSAIAETISHTIAVGALFIVVLVLGETPTWTWFAVVPIVLTQAVFNLGLSFLVARLAFHFRDIQNLLPHLLRFWMYLSGLFFSIEFVTQRVGVESPLVTVFEANPGYIFMTLMRGALMGQYTIEGRLALWGLAWTLFAVTAGFMFFRQREVEYSGG
jgi:teichoic acid transport system permease protein